MFHESKIVNFAGKIDVSSRRNTHERFFFCLLYYKLRFKTETSDKFFN